MFWLKTLFSCFMSETTGNCLYCSISLLLVGNNSLVEILRCSTSLELHQNASFYIKFLYFESYKYFCFVGIYFKNFCVWPNRTFCYVSDLCEHFVVLRRQFTETSRFPFCAKKISEFLIAFLNICRDTKFFILLLTKSFQGSWQGMLNFELYFMLTMKFFYPQVVIYLCFIALIVFLKTVL